MLFYSLLSFLTFLKEKRGEGETGCCFPDTSKRGTYTDTRRTRETTR